MAISEVPVDPSFQEGFKRVQEVEPVMVTNDSGESTGEQRTDRRTKLPLWQVSVSVKDGDRKPDMIHVKVPSGVKPDVDDKHPVFGGLRARQWSMKGNNDSVNGGLSWTAETVAAKEDMPSKARQSVGAPPKPSQAAA